MTSNSNIPHDLKWVEALEACSVKQVFRELHNGIENDVANINAITRFPPDNRFTAGLTSGGDVLIVAQNGVSERLVKFSLGNGRIEIKDEVTPRDWRVTLTLNNEGRCKLKLEDGTELELWQIRRIALQGLFFGTEYSVEHQ